MKESFRFDTFIEAPSNIFASLVCSSAAENMGFFMNPIWLYGPSGCGKSHLLKALCTSAASDGAEVLYITSEDAGQALVSMLRGVSFSWEHLERAQLLVIDNIDFILGKDVTQQTFAELIMKKCRNGDQIAIASEGKPSQFTSLWPLFENIESAVDAEIRFPEAELRRAFIRKYIATNPFSITSSAVKMLCECRISVSQLEGVLRTARFWSYQHGKRITLKWIKEYTSNSKEKNA